MELVLSNNITKKRTEKDWFGNEVLFYFCTISPVMSDMADFPINWTTKDYSVEDSGGLYTIPYP